VALNDDQAHATGRILPQPLHLANEGLAFLLELAMVAGLAWWGSQAVSGIAGRVALAILAPAAAVIIWALLAAPRARIRLPLPGVLAVKAMVFAGAAVAVYSMGQHALAIVFAVVTAVNTALAAVDRQALMATRAGLPFLTRDHAETPRWPAARDAPGQNGTDGTISSPIGGLQGQAGAGLARGATE
jgi:hypothetical protein